MYKLHCVGNRIEPCGNLACGELKVIRSPGGYVIVIYGIYFYYLFTLFA
jgi:hypothetical protein